MNATVCSDCDTSPSPTETVLVGWRSRIFRTRDIDPDRHMPVHYFSLHMGCDTSQSIQTSATWYTVQNSLYSARRSSPPNLLLWKDSKSGHNAEGWNRIARKQQQDISSSHMPYLSMLALRYHTPRGDKVIWPNQYTWLLKQGLIDWKEHASWGSMRRKYATGEMQIVPQSW